MCAAAEMQLTSPAPSCGMSGAFEQAAASVCGGEAHAWLGGGACLLSKAVEEGLEAHLAGDGVVATGVVLLQLGVQPRLHRRDSRRGRPLLAVNQERPVQSDCQPRASPAAVHQELCTHTVPLTAHAAQYAALCMPYQAASAAGAHILARGTSSITQQHQGSF